MNNNFMNVNTYFKQFAVENGVSSLHNSEKGGSSSVVSSEDKKLTTARSKGADKGPDACASSTENINLYREATVLAEKIHKDAKRELPPAPYMEFTSLYVGQGVSSVLGHEMCVQYIKRVCEQNQDFLNFDNISTNERVSKENDTKGGDVIMSFPIGPKIVVEVKPMANHRLSDKQKHVDILVGHISADFVVIDKKTYVYEGEDKPDPEFANFAASDLVTGLAGLLVSSNHVVAYYDHFNSAYATEIALLGNATGNVKTIKPHHLVKSGVGISFTDWLVAEMEDEGVWDLTQYLYKNAKVVPTKKLPTADPLILIPIVMMCSPKTDAQIVESRKEVWGQKKVPAPVFDMIKPFLGIYHINNNLLKFTCPTATAEGVVEKSHQLEIEGVNQTQYEVSYENVVKSADEISPLGSGAFVNWMSAAYDHSLLEKKKDEKYDMYGYNSPYACLCALAIAAMVHSDFISADLNNTGFSKSGKLIEALTCYNFDRNKINVERSSTVNGPMVIKGPHFDQKSFRMENGRYVYEKLNLNPGSDQIPRMMNTELVLPKVSDTVLSMGTMKFQSTEESLYAKFLLDQITPYRIRGTDKLDLSLKLSHVINVDGIEPESTRLITGNNQPINLPAKSVIGKRFPQAVVERLLNKKIPQGVNVTIVTSEHLTDKRSYAEFSMRQIINDGVGYAKSCKLDSDDLEIPEIDMYEQTRTCFKSGRELGRKGLYPDVSISYSSKDVKFINKGLLSPNMGFAMSLLRGFVQSTFKKKSGDTEVKKTVNLTAYDPLNTASLEEALDTGTMPLMRRLLQWQICMSKWMSIHCCRGKNVHRFGSFIWTEDHYSIRFPEPGLINEKMSDSSFLWSIRPEEEGRRAYYGFSPGLGGNHYCFNEMADWVREGIIDRSLRTLPVLMQFLEDPSVVMKGLSAANGPFKASWQLDLMLACMLTNRRSCQYIGDTLQLAARHNQGWNNLIDEAASLQQKYADDPCMAFLPLLVVMVKDSTKLSREQKHVMMCARSLCGTETETNPLTLKLNTSKEFEKRESMTMKCAVFGSILKDIERQQGKPLQVA